LKAALFTVFLCPFSVGENQSIFVKFNRKRRKALINLQNNSNLIEYKRLNLTDLSPDMLTHFIRRQEVKKTWRKINNEWVLIDNPFVADWDEDFRKQLINEDFPQAINSGGALFAGFYSGKLIAFFAVDGSLCGSVKQYAWLVYAHVSADFRHLGVGRKLFMLSAEFARTIGAKKMYISTFSSEETQAFYRAMGCTDAEEIIPELFEAEPFDVHLEFNLKTQRRD
jgi:GNAT superfamily N-acetyltransferase